MELPKFRTCCICNKANIPYVDWRWWHDGKPVHFACIWNKMMAELPEEETKDLGK
jgi:hypothetical protein